MPVRESVAQTVRARRKKRGWTPFNGPQLAAYIADSTVDDIGYGGAGGGGKTDLALALGMLKHRRTIFYRREYPQLQGAVDRSAEVYRRKGKYNEQKHRWRLRDKRIVQFGAMQREVDREKWRGIACDLRVFDEAQNFLESQVRFTMAWTRTNVPGQKCTNLLCFNPPTSEEGLWVIDFFKPWLDREHPNPALDGEVRWFARVGDDELEVDGPEPIPVEDGPPITPRSRTFFHAYVQNNPVYMASGYMAQLQALPEPLRSQMLRGDFSAGIEDDAWQVIPMEWILAAQARWQAMGGKRPEGSALSALGVDVARGGRDRTVLSRRFGNWFDALEVLPGSKTPDGPTGAKEVTRAMLGFSAPANVDVIGIGASVYDQLRQQGATTVNAVNFASSSYRRDKSGALKFANLRAECYWLLREALDPTSGKNICLPPGRGLAAELAAPRWDLTPQGILLRPKDEIEKRLGRSPDEADAVVLAFHDAPKAGVFEL